MHYNRRQLSVKVDITIDLHLLPILYLYIVF